MSTPLVFILFTFRLQVVIFAVAVIAVVYLFVQRRAKPALGILAVILILSCLGFGNTMQVRLDTGDQRDLFWGIPFHYRNLDPESRRALLSLGDSDVPNQWIWCATAVGWNQVGFGVQRDYRCAAAWVNVDPEIAKLIVRDLAAYVQSTHALRGLPSCTSMLWPPVIDPSKFPYQVIAEWKTDQGVRDYLDRRGYFRESH
jgi:hypothetical protein